MRRIVIALLLAATASAAPDVVKLKPIDVKAVFDKLDVFKDETGNYYVVPKPGAIDGDQINDWVFFGDGKSMYRQRVIGYSLDGAERDWNVWAPRARNLSTGTMHIEPDKSYVQCKQSGDDKHRPLTLLTADEARTLIKRAKFYPPLWQRRAHYLARDDNGVYYYVDAIQEEYGGPGFRVFVGQKGGMKQMPMVSMASDSAGEIFSTKNGQLKIITDREGKAAFWIKGGKKTELTVLPPIDNRYLIYRELGIYGQLGALCDDQ